MKIQFFSAILILSIFLSCRQTAVLPTEKDRNFVSEVSYTISRTESGESNTVKAAPIAGVFYHSVYPVLNIPNEKDVIFTIHPEVSEEVEVVSYFSFSFLMSIPENILTEPDMSGPVGPIQLVNPENYPQLLLDDDEENGRRVCFTKEGQNPDGSPWIHNACAGEGWYSEQGSFEFEFTHYELFYDENNSPNIYTEGHFEATTESIGNGSDRFQLSNGVFKLVIPLSLE